MHRRKLWSLLFIQVSLVWLCEKRHWTYLQYLKWNRKLHSALNMRRRQVPLSVWCHVFTSRNLQHLAVIRVGSSSGRRCELLKKYSVLHCCEYICKFALDFKFAVHHVHHWSPVSEWHCVQRHTTIQVPVFKCVAPCWIFILVTSILTTFFLFYYYS